MMTPLVLARPMRAFAVASFLLLLTLGASLGHGATPSDSVVTPGDCAVSNARVSIVDSMSLDRYAEGTSPIPPNPTSNKLPFDTTLDDVGPSAAGLQVEYDCKVLAASMAPGSPGCEPQTTFNPPSCVRIPALGVDLAEEGSNWGGSWGGWIRLDVPGHSGFPGGPGSVVLSDKRVWEEFGCATRAADGSAGCALGATVHVTQAISIGAHWDAPELAQNPAALPGSVWFSRVSFEAPVYVAPIRHATCQQGWGDLNLLLVYDDMCGHIWTLVGGVNVYPPSPAPAYALIPSDALP